ncbi:hypothetical protein [Reichenbachiella versicolor]|uniref:hypothetical protein n=1 Tax=Reichenbachiella versicolor TaxID=1821036 RepID=UPI000D6EA8A8|nr:hypothetical protein [Reichenbachiella versicolor]
MKLLLLLQLSLSLFFPSNLVKTEVAEKIFMSLPNGFRPMTDDEIASKYFTMQRPMAMYTDQSLIVDIGVNKATSRWSEKDMDIMKSFQKSNIYNLYDKVDMISEGIKEVNGKQYVYFEFISTVKGDPNSFKDNKSIRKYTYIQYAIFGTTSLIFNLTCPATMKDRWQNQASDIMNSIIVKAKFK